MTKAEYHMEAKDVMTIFKGPIEMLLGRIATELQQGFSNRLFEYQIEEYKRNFYSKTILHRAAPKPLNEFYQPLFIKELKKGTGASARISTASAKKLFSKWNYITLIGSAGSGKSTIVKYLFVNCFEEEYKIPIKIELRYLNEYKGSLNEFIFNEIFKFQKLGFSNTIIDRLLDSDGFIFFLDGYDEINSTIKSQTTKDIDAFVKKYPNNKYVITSRPHTSIDLLPMFTNFMVTDLDDNEIASFVKKQIPSSESELAEKIIKAIFKKENTGYKSFLSNPLLLSMFVLTFQSYSDIPKKRSEFYYQVFDTLFSVHDSMSKLAYVREKLCGLSKEQFEEVLELFSFVSYFEEKFIFPPRYLEDKLSQIKKIKSKLSFDTQPFIEDLQVAIGILNKEGLDYTFPHRSLQEYFAASYIEGLGVENKKNLYEKLKRDIQSNYSILLTKDHFFNLLIEIDYNNCSRYLSIPLIEEAYYSLSKIEKIDEAIAYEYYAKLLLPFYILLKTLELHIDIHKEIIDEEIHFVFFGGHQNNQFEIPKDIKNSNDEFLKRMNFPLMIEKITHFKNYGINVVNRLKKNIDDIDKSDEEIIKLI